MNSRTGIAGEKKCDANIVRLISGDPGGNTVWFGRSIEKPMCATWCSNNELMRGMERIVREATCVTRHIINKPTCVMERIISSLMRVIHSVSGMRPACRTHRP